MLLSEIQENGLIISDLFSTRQTQVKFQLIENGYQRCPGKHLIPGRFFKDIYVYTQMHTLSMYITKCRTSNIHTMEEKK